MGAGYSVKISLAAAEDLNEIFSYIALDLKSPEAGKRRLAAIDKAMGMLSDFPLMAPICEDETLKEMEYRKLATEGCIAIYQVSEKQKVVFVLRVFGERQDFAKYLR